MWEQGIIGLITLLLLLSLGILLANLFLRTADRLDRLSIAFPLGSGIYTWVLFLLSWMGIRLTPITLLSTEILLLMITSFLLKLTRNGSFASLRRGKIRPVDWGQLGKVIVGVVSAILVMLVVIFAIGRSYSSWDAMAIWSVKGYGIAFKGTIFAGERWGEFGLTYPLNISLLIASFEILGLEQLPVSKAIFPLLYASLILGCYVFLSKRRVPSKFAGLGSLFLAATPMVFEHGTIGYANLPFGVFLALGVFHAIRGFLDKDRGRQSISGILLALAGWTRPEGILVIPIVICALFLSHKISRQSEIYWRCWLIPVIGLLGPWLVFSSRFAEDSLMLTAGKEALTAIGNGQLRLDGFYLITRFMLRQLLTPSIWGVILPVAILLVAFNAQKFRPSVHPDIFATFIVAGSVTVSTIFHFYIVSFLGTLTSWLPTSANRMFLPTAILLSTCVLLLAGKEPQHEQTSQPQTVSMGS